ncbi:GntR family transcriptional regulator [Lutimonas sp.]|uniref:GntR family transcriptional regulator n=1 Tax=Lutimonas sp. TaxID=1872403 RepID=UPI003D9B41E7
MQTNIDFLELNHSSDTPKYQQLVNSITNAIANNILSQGDPLPSVNTICKTHHLSRDTVFKAYTVLKEQRVIESVPNKGYYVASSTKKILLVLDTFKAYKEVLYHSFIQNLPSNYITDVQFHHYNIDNFTTIINNGKGKYFKYVVMNFDDVKVNEVISTLPLEKLLIIDWNIHAKEDSNYVCQNFGSSFYRAMEEAKEMFMKYNELCFLYPEFTNHPIETVTFFKSFCETHHMNYQVLTDPTSYTIKEGSAYISVSDRVLANFLKQCKEKNLEPGLDVGFLSYNETPMKEFIYKGITVVSTDFKVLGTKAASFIMNDQPLQEYIETRLIIRESL